jgi:hypothetical protein
VAAATQQESDHATGDNCQRNARPRIIMDVFIGGLANVAGGFAGAFLKILEPLGYFGCIHRSQHNRPKEFAQWGSHPKMKLKE